MELYFFKYKFILPQTAKCHSDTRLLENKFPEQRDVISLDCGLSVSVSGTGVVQTHFCDYWNIMWANDRALIQNEIHEYVNDWLGHTQQRLGASFESMFLREPAMLVPYTEPGLATYKTNPFTPILSLSKAMTGFHKLSLEIVSSQYKYA